MTNRCTLMIISIIVSLYSLWNTSILIKLKLHKHEVQRKKRNKGSHRTVLKIKLQFPRIGSSLNYILWLTIICSLFSRFCCYSQCLKDIEVFVVFLIFVQICINISTEKPMCHMISQFTLLWVIV